MSSCSRRITLGRTSFSSQRSMASRSAASSAGSVWRGARAGAGNAIGVLRSSGLGSSSLQRNYDPDPELVSVVGLDFHFVAGALHDQHGAVELAHLDALLVQPDGLDADDAGAGTAVRFALVEHFRLGIERVA